MAFTHPWDTTQPPDTQPANLLGQDLRDLKTDIQQRMGAFGAGLLANRPTPDTGPANFTGVMYFSTDTGQVFRWNGGSWDDITTNIGSGSFIKDYDNYAPSVFAVAAPGPGQNVFIPIGGVQAANPVGSYLEIETAFHVSSFTGPQPAFIVSISASPTAPVNVLVGPNTDNFIRCVIPLSNGSLPLAACDFDSYNPGTTISTTFVSRTALSVIDGSVGLNIATGFQLCTTITARIDFLHVRVRK